MYMQIETASYTVEKNIVVLLVMVMLKSLAYYEEEESEMRELLLLWHGNAVFMLLSIMHE